MAGGIGITPLLGLLQGIALAKQSCPGVGPSRVHLVWTSRDLHEFTIMDRHLLSSLWSVSPGGAAEGRGWLTLELHHTGGGCRTLMPARDLNAPPSYLGTYLERGVQEP